MRGRHPVKRKTAANCVDYLRRQTAYAGHRRLNAIAKHARQRFSHQSATATGNYKITFSDDFGRHPTVALSRRTRTITLKVDRL
jgi:hypothetical protein